MTLTTLNNFNDIRTSGRKNCRRKSGFREDFDAGDFLMVHQFYCFISLEAKKSQILIQIEKNRVLWLKLVANRIYLSAPFGRLWSLCICISVQV